MKIQTSGLTARIWLALILPVLTGYSAICQGFSHSAKARLQFVIDSFQNNPSNPYVGGMSVAIDVDGLASWSGVTGYAARNVDKQNNLLPGGTRFTGTTLSRIYSVTKTFTSALVLELAKEGAFSLEDPVSKFLPLSQVNPGLNNTVTIRQLLAHESGYSNYTDELQLQIAVAYQPTHVWTPVEMLSFVHQVTVPGTERRYSSTNYIILGAIIEAATGIPVERHFRKRFFKPLHLNATFLGEREPLWMGARLASPHDNLSPFNSIFQLTGQPTFPDAYTNVSVFPFTGIVSLAFTGGAIVSNAGDMAKWGNALFGSRATSRSTFNTLINSISTTPDDDGDFLGYGIFRTTRISATDIFIGHDGRAPGYRSVMFYQPDKKMTIAILTNYYGANLYNVAKALYESLPEFTCGNKNSKEDKIVICFKGHHMCVDRKAAAVQINKGAWLGACQKPAVHPVDKPAIKQTDQVSANAGIKIFPNPASRNTTIAFRPATTGKITIVLYDINGSYVLPIFKGYAEKNVSQQVEINTSNLPAGTYVVRLQTQQIIKQERLVLIK
ncbi:MAG: serine hydrolase [Agriterribacter sp.]